MTCSTTTAVPTTHSILVGDVSERLREMPAAWVHCVVTSPPYWGLRDYGVDGQIGREAAPKEYVERLVGVFRDVRRVLRDDGTLWLNLGDSFLKNGLAGVPWMVAFALKADGWHLRSEVIWHKPNPMTESVKNRPSRAHEVMFLLTKSSRYYYDAVAVAEPAKWATEKLGEGQTRNLRSVWTVPVARYRDAHFATFPEKLVEPCVKAGTSERGVCVACGAPWRRLVERTRVPTRPGVDTKCLAHSDGDVRSSNANGWARANVIGNRDPQRHVTKTTTVGWERSCGCDAAAVPAVVLDPFAGSGTTLAVAKRLGRSGVGVELNAAYAEMARRRIDGVKAA